jgi:hypothetical protein
MQPIRSKNTYAAEADDFYNNLLLVCPNCEQQATGTKFRKEDRFNTEAIKVVCTHCGFNKVYDTSRIPLQLWLKTECEGHILGALNFEHLQFLKSHVEAFLRERNTLPNKNKSIGSRLPRWMTSKKNRDKVLKCIEKLMQNKHRD